MRRLRKTVMIFFLLCFVGMAQAGAIMAPLCAWTTREVNTHSLPQDDALDGGLIAEGVSVMWLETQGKWALVDAQGDQRFVPVDVLTTDRVFRFDSHPTKSMDWPYEGELRISPDGRTHISIALTQEAADEMLFGSADLCCFEVIDELTGELICTAQPDMSGDPFVYTGEGVYTQGTELRVVPVLRHDGYSVEIQW